MEKDEKMRLQAIRQAGIKYKQISLWMTAAMALAILFSSFGIKADIFAGIHSLITDDYVASLTYALFFVAIHAVMGVWMYHKKIFIKL